SKKSAYKPYNGPPRTPVQTACDGENPLDRVKAFKTVTAEAAKKSPEQQTQEVAELQLCYQRETDALMRAKLLEAIASYPTADVDSIFKSALMDQNPAVRLSVVNAYIKRGESAVPMLAEIATNDSDVDVKLAAARALGELGGKDATAALGSLLEDTNPAVQFRAMQALSDATGKKLGNDINAWKSYVQSGVEPKPPTFVERITPKIF
ncbi:MAG TPA: HEAT repeat domain-containing protein, partial [Pirellulales bacterium]